MSFFVKAAIKALQEVPAVNAEIDGEEVVYNDFTDISIAVSAPRGLSIPNTQPSPWRQKRWAARCAGWPTGPKGC